MKKPINPEVTAHALKRWDERGNGNDMQEEYKKALPFGAQLDGSAYFITNDKIVFVVKKIKDFYRISTVLTYDQAMANMATYIKSSPQAILLPEDERKNVAQQHKYDTLSDETKSQLKKLAEHRFRRGDKKGTKKLIASLGYDRDGIEYDYYLHIMKEIKDEDQKQRKEYFENRNKIQ